jgi:putative DNA methylase
MTEYRKKLVETALPLEAINAACKADKDRATGTIRNLHKWFAPMPVPALRALMFASLVDDPDDPKERARLLELVEGLVASVASNPESEVLDAAKEAMAESVNELPTVLDPFCGGGSTLVEAQRLGLPSRGSDLNPIPVLISKALTELPPPLVDRPPLHREVANNSGLFEEGSWQGLSGLLCDVEYYAKRIRDEAWNRIGHLYPLAPNGDPVIAWWWARTIESPDPRFQGTRVPLVNSWWLTKKPGETTYLRPIVDVSTKSIEYTIETEGAPVATQKETCLFSGAPIPFPYIRDKGIAGELGVAMMAVISHGKCGRKYHLADDAQLAAARSAHSQSLLNLALPEKAIGFRVQGYGMTSWGDLFTERQQMALEVFAELVSKVPQWVTTDGGDEHQARAITTFLGLALGKLAQHLSCLVRWRTGERQSEAKAAFGRHDLSMSWDFAEINPFGGFNGDWMQIVKTASRAYGFIEPHGPTSSVVQCDARVAGAGLEGQCFVLTDPPYFSAIGYANLSDYFYPWMRLALRGQYPELFATIATPKSGELIAEPARHESKEEAKNYFINGFTETFTSLRKASRPDLPLLIVYAYKEQESEDQAQVSSGWEAMLEAVIRSGLSVVGTWPIYGSGAKRMVGHGNNALATYVVLVCRPRPSASARVSRRDLSSALRAEMGPAIEVLQSAAVAPVDLAQAVIGPGMAVFTRYQAVLEPDGTPMTVRSALLLINSVLAEVIDQQEGEFDADTRWAITWFEQFQFGEALSGEADSLARAKVTSIDGLERAGIIATRGGTCRLVRRDELLQDYDPTGDRRPTVWESVQHLVKRLTEGSEEAAADLFMRLPNSEVARDLAYRLYSICERKGWAEEGTAYNVLVASWPEISRLAQQLQTLQQQDRGLLPGFE